MGQGGGQRRDAIANRQAVIDAAAVLLAEDPTASMQEIADFTGLGRSTVYRHFPNRDELSKATVEEVVGRAVTGVDGLLEGNAGIPETMRSIGSFLVEFGLRYRSLYPYRQVAMPTLRGVTRSAHTPLARYLAAAQERGEVRSDQPVTWLIAQLVALVIAMVGDVLAERIDREIGPDVLGETLVAMAVPR